MGQRTKCYINARFLTQSITGVQRTASELVTALDRLIDSAPMLSDTFEFEMLAPRNVKRELNLGHIPLRTVGMLTGHLWEQIELPVYSRNGVLASLCNVAPLLKRRQMVMIHDASIFASPETYSFAFRSWYKLLYPSLGRICPRIMTVSEFSKRELMNYAHVPEDKLTVVYNGCEHIGSVDPDYSILNRLDQTGRPFILAVSSMSPNKNFGAIMRAMSLLDHRDFDVVVAGGTNPRIFQQQDVKLPDTMRYLGYVTDGQLRALYERATGFIYPSTYEGFGLPPVEAMMCGCPVIVAAIEPLREVCGDAALYCDPNDPGDIATRMSQLARDKILRERLIDLGHQRAAMFTWDRAARGFLEQLHAVTEGTEKASPRMRGMQQS